MRVSNRAWLAGCVVAVLGVLPGHVAAAAASQQGIAISPFQQALSIAPDDTDRSFTITLTNHTKSLQELAITARDFGSLNDSGGILLDGSKAYTQKYGLTSWIKLGTDTVVLQPGESQAVPVTIENRASLQPGGHYGAVVASVNSLDTQDANKVIINQQLVSLLFVKKVGGEHYNLHLSEIHQNGNWLHLPNDVRLRFQNPGNVHVVPRGVVQLKNPAGKVLAQGVINSESAYILPESYRELYVPLTTIDHGPPLPGLYHVEVSYRYDGIAQTVTKRVAVQFVSLGMYLVLALFVALIFVIFRVRRRRTQKPPVTE